VCVYVCACMCMSVCVCVCVCMVGVCVCVLCGGCVHARVHVSTQIIINILKIKNK